MNGDEPSHIAITAHCGAHSEEKLINRSVVVKFGTSQAIAKSWGQSITRSGLIWWWWRMTCSHRQLVKSLPVWALQLWWTLESPGAGSGGLFSGGDPEEESTRNNPDNTTAAALATSFAWQNPTMEIVLGWLEAALYLVLKAIFYLAHLYFNY